MNKNKNSIVNLFTEAKINQTYLKVCAPMVRYSKIHFRTLVRNFGVDLCFTPMILADSFCQNEKARSNEFKTTATDFPLVVQFAANNSNDFVDASTLVYPYADGVDINCGCPQRWAIKDGYGCALLSKPQLIQDMVKTIRNNLPNCFSVSVKMRILKDLRKTVEICQQLEMCGATFLTVHGRTLSQKTGDNINIDTLKEVCKSIRIPMVANGGVKTLTNADNLYEEVNCNGVMAASHILTNPTLFTGSTQTTLNCVKLWVHMKDNDRDKITFQCYHHHLVFMLDKILTKKQKQIFNNLSTFESVDDFLYKYVINSNDESTTQYEYNLDNFITCQFSDEITLKHSSKCRYCSKSVYYCNCSNYNSNDVDGSFFSSYIKENDGLDYMDSNIFDELK